MSGITMSDLDKRLSELEESHRARTRKLSAQLIAQRTLVGILWDIATKADKEQTDQVALSAIEEEFQKLIDEGAISTSEDRDFLEMCRDEVRSLLSP